MPENQTLFYIYRDGTVRSEVGPNMPWLAVAGHFMEGEKRCLFAVLSEEAMKAIGAVFLRGLEAETKAIEQAIALSKGGE